MEGGSEEGGSREALTAWFSFKNIVIINRISRSFL